MGFQTPIPFSNKTTEQSRDENVNAYESLLKLYSTNLFVPDPQEEAMHLDVPNRTNHRVQPRPPRASRVRHTEACNCKGGGGQVSASLERSSITNPALTQEYVEEQACIDDEEEVLTQDVPDWRMQELSELAMSLYAQLLASDPENQQPTSGTKLRCSKSS